MRYEKPLVVDLSAGARARGQWPLSCLIGNGASGTEICATGNGAKSYCSVGNGVKNPVPSCVGGGTVNPPGDCYSGGNASGYYCEAGVSGADDPTGCNAGLSYA